MDINIKKAIKIMHSPVFVGAYIAGLFYFISYYLYNEGREILSLYNNVHPDIIVLVFLVIIMSYLVRVFLSQKIYHINGTDITYPQMLRVLSISKMGRYVPGKIWFASGYYLMSRKYNIEPQAIARNYIISNALLIVTALICSIPALILIPMPLNVSWLSMLLFILILMCILHPRVLNYLFKSTEKLIVRFTGRDLFNQAEQGTDMPIRYLVSLFAGFSAMVMISGFNLYLILSALHSVSPEHYLLYLSAAALSRTIGLLALFAPGGIGVQESVAAFILSPVVSLKITVMAVVFLRVLYLISDVVFALLSLIPERAWNSVQERFEAIFILLKLVYVKSALIVRSVKERLSILYDLDKTGSGKRKLAAYIRQHAGDIFGLSEEQKLRQISIDKLSKSRAHDAFLVEAIVEDPLGGVSARKCVAKKYGLKGMYTRTKVNLIIYGRQILKMQKIPSPEIVMEAEIAAEKIIRESNINMPGILYADFSSRHIYSEYIEGQSLDEIVHGIFSGKDIFDQSRKRLCNNAGRMLFELHRKGLVHGDTSLNNWICQKETGDIFLIDWENVTMHGDPGFDLAHVIYSIGADAEMLDTERMDLFDEVIHAILEGYDRSFTGNEYVKRIAHYWDNWILITPIRVQERIFRVIHEPCPRIFVMLKKMPIPVFNRHSLMVRKRTLIHKVAEMFQALNGIGFLLIGKSVRRYPIGKLALPLTAKDRK